MFALCLLLLGVQPPDDSLESLAAGLKPLLARALPAVLYEKNTNWGHQEPAPNGIRWHGIHPEVVLTPKNDGHWRKLRIATQDLEHTLVLNVSDFKAVDAERQAFKVFLGMRVGVAYEHQHWDKGLRLWSGSIRARLQLKVALDCESLLRAQKSKGLLPDLIFRLRVTHADVGYDNLVVEHINGIGGSAARLIGETLRSTLKLCKPSLEQDLLDRADAAIIKAADTREVRLSLGRLRLGNTPSIDR
jgi:hypothetical protein